MDQHRICPKDFKIAKPIDKTIHWKAHEQHLLMVLAVFGWIHCEGSHQFSDMFTSSLRSTIGSS
jgi:hypothetical protein